MLEGAVVTPCDILNGFSYEMNGAVSFYLWCSVVTQASQSSNLRHCYRGAAEKLHWCYSGVTVVLQWYYSSITVLLQGYYSNFTAILQSQY
jgi:hypothetical protein